MVREGLKAMLAAKEPDFRIVGDAANAEQALDLIARRNLPLRYWIYACPASTASISAG